MAAHGESYDESGESLALASRREGTAERQAGGSRAQRGREAEEQARVFEAVVDGLVVYDAQGRVVRANAAARQLLGMNAVPGERYEQPVAERASFYRLSDQQGRLLPPGDGPVSRVLRGEVLTGADALAIRLGTPDGRAVDLLVSGAPLRDSAGRISGAVCVYRDATESNRLAAIAREQSQRLEATFSAIADPLLVYDRDGNVVLMNPAAEQLIRVAEFSALAPAERAARVVLTDETGHLIPEASWPLRRILRGEVLAGVRSPEFVLHLPDGRRVVASSTGAPLRDPDGTIVGAVQVIRDETERKRLEREREEAEARELATREVNRQLDEFFTTAAHDIRSPVTATSGAVQMAIRRFDRLRAEVNAGTADAGKALEGIRESLVSAEQSAERLIRLADRLFDVARARAGALDLRLALCDLRAFVQGHVETYRLAAPARTIRLSLPDEPVMVVADADHLGQVLTNYITNALKYSAEVQPVDVRLEVTEGVAVVAVQDRGPGLPWEEQSRVWDMLHRAPGVAVLSGSEGSLGMGLYICKHIMERHPGGRVGVESVVGEGSTFWFSLTLRGAND